MTKLTEDLGFEENLTSVGCLSLPRAIYMYTCIWPLFLKPLVLLDP